MVGMDVFNQDPFKMIQLTTAVEKMPYVPDGLTAMGIFRDKPIRTNEFWIEEREGQLIIVPFSDRGAPRTQRVTERRKAKAFQTYRLGHEDTIYAHEIKDIREFGQESALKQVQSEVMRRLVGDFDPISGFAGGASLRANLFATQEFHKLAAVQGYLLDADGSIVYNFFDEFGITPNTPINFDLHSRTSGALRPLIDQLSIAMRRKSRGAMLASTRIIALCGDEFWSSFYTHPDIEKTYQNWTAATELRKGMAFGNYTFGDIEWVHYRGTDDTMGIRVALTKDSVTATPVSLIGLSTGMNVSGYGIADNTTVVVGDPTITLSSAFTGTTGTYLLNFGSGPSKSGGGKIAIPANKAIFFPVGAPNIFQRVLAPGESFEYIGQLGKPEYVRMIPDRDRNEYVKLEMDVYPLHICTRPEVLFSGISGS